MAAFATETGIYEDLRSDKETALGDLLADLMHWCDACGANGRPARAVDFEAALKRARAHYINEANEHRSRAGRSIRPPRSQNPSTSQVS
jgi:hypothetical protein